DFELLLCHGTVCVVGKIRDLILQLSKSSIYSTKPLATTTFFNSSLSPTVSTTESLKDAQEEMADSEMFCKRLVQAVKLKKTTSKELRSNADKMLKEARKEFEHDGDMDKLELVKYHYELVIGSARIAEE
ncbi:hypothetical protein, partial [Enterobacter cloacae]